MPNLKRGNNILDEAKYGSRELGYESFSVSLLLNAVQWSDQLSSHIMNEGTNESVYDESRKSYSSRNRNGAMWTRKGRRKKNNATFMQQRFTEIAMDVQQNLFFYFDRIHECNDSVLFATLMQC